MSEQNDFIDKLKGIKWRSKSVIVAISGSVLGLIVLGIGQFFTLESKVDYSIYDYIMSIGLFTFVILALPTAFSELGKVNGFSSKEMKDVLEENNEHFEEIGKNNWERDLEIENELDNVREKLRVLKVETLNKLAKDPNNQELQQLKSNILKFYEYLDTEDEGRKIFIKKELDENNFDIDMFDVAYEHIEYNDLFGIQSSSLSKRKRKLNINKLLLKQAMIKRSVIIIVGGYMSAFGLLFGFSLLALLMFIYQVALVAWTCFTTYNSAFGLVINELREIIRNNNTFLKTRITKFKKRIEEEKDRPPTPEELEELERKAEEKAERDLERQLKEEERKFEREFKIAERKMKHEARMAEIKAKSEQAQAQIYATKHEVNAQATKEDVNDKNNQNDNNVSKVVLEVRGTNEKR